MLTFQKPLQKYFFCQSIKNFSQYLISIMDEGYSQSYEYTNNQIDIQNSFKDNSYMNEGEFKQDFVLLGTIGNGQFGIVQKYQIKKTKQIIAIKRSHTKCTNQSENRLKKEYDLMNMFDEKYLLKPKRLYFDLTNEDFFLLLPFCEQGNLSQYLEKNKNLDESKRISICHQISRGINALHSHPKKIMHRDLKPENILVDSNKRIKLCDFGCSRQDIDFVFKTTQVGTPIYRDLNVTTGKYSRKCDIFSAGLIFYWIFTGKNFYVQTQMDKLKLQQTQSDETMISKIKELSCNEQIKEIITCCLKKQEKDRICSEDLQSKLYKLIDQDEKKIILDELHEQEVNMTRIRNLQTKSYDYKMNKNESYDKSNRNNRTFYQNTPNNNTTGNILWQIQEQPHHKNSNSGSCQNSSNDKNSNKTSQNLLVRLLKKKQINQDNRIKNNNFKVIYEFFVLRFQKFKKIDMLSSISSLTKAQKQVLQFLVFFGYLRFLKIHQRFLKGPKIDQSISKSVQLVKIEGIALSDISDLTKEKCLQSIEPKQKVVREKLKHFSHQINQNKGIFLNDKKKSCLIISMINICIEKSFLDIEKVDQNTISEQLERVLFIDNGKTQSLNEINLKKQFLSIRQIF